MKREIVKQFFEFGIFQVKESLFRLASGKTSPIYLDHRKIYSHPQLRSQVTEEWAKVLKPFINSEVNFVGTATAGIVPAFALAEKFTQTFAYVRAKPKEYGTGSLIEGTLTPSAPMIIVDDMVTTGGSLLLCYASIKDQFPNSQYIATAITRHDLPQAQKKLQELTLVTLFTSAEILRIALEEKLIKESEYVLATSWLKSQSEL